MIKPMFVDKGSAKGIKLAELPFTFLSIQTQIHNITGLKTVYILRQKWTEL